MVEKLVAKAKKASNFKKAKNKKQWVDKIASLAAIVGIPFN